ncbi:MAG: hypothetical protein RBG13Loki_1785 [Promethearchaeota archaeon CR_4]|nr:MAG: hypothetical protein RBG13Loki_1785 [Candidatus Lokiarchaeota archaeon CR_4]
MAQIPAWNIKNVAEREQGTHADVVPQHDTYEDFAREYRKGFSEYYIMTRKYGILDICHQILDLPTKMNLLENFSFTNAAKCTNRSGTEKTPNHGYTASQVTSDITAMLANCREHLYEEITVLDPDVIITFDRTLLPLLASQREFETQDEISFFGNIGGRDRLCVAFYHPSMAGVNYARSHVPFNDRIQKIRTAFRR